jgi:regulator of nucleoside diphosphate kinase
MHPVDTLPPVTFSCTDYNELVFALGLMRDREAAKLLAWKVQHAELYRPDDLPDDVVALNCRVVFHLAGDPAIQARLLVHPHTLLCPNTELSVLSPVGAALMGLRVGDCMSFVEHGERREIVVEAVGMRFVGRGVPRWIETVTSSQLESACPGAGMLINPIQPASTTLDR